MDYLNNTEESYLTPEEEGRIFGKFATKEGEPNLTKIIYQSYSASDDNNPAVYLVNGADVSIRSDVHNPGFVFINIIFKSTTDPALSLLAKKLSTFDKNVERYPEKDWIFYMTISKVEELSEGKDLLLSANFANPVMWCLSRIAPTQLSPEVKEGEDLYGGNVLKLVVSAANFEVEESDEEDFSELKSEILRSIDAQNFS